MAEIITFSYNAKDNPGLHRFLSQKWERGTRSRALVREMEAHFSGNRVPEPENDNGRLKRIETLLERIETRISRGSGMLEIVNSNGDVELPADVLENLNIFG